MGRDKKDMRKREKGDGMKIRVNGWNKETWRGGHVMRSPKRKQLPTPLNN